MSTSGSAFVEDTKVGVRLKISALWVVLLFLYAYGDIFGVFKPGQIEDIVSGQISGIDITEGFLFAVSVYVAIASVMIFLTLVLRPAAARWCWRQYKGCSPHRTQSGAYRWWCRY